MQIKNLRKLNKYDALFCLIFSVIIFFLFNNVSFFNSILGELNLPNNNIGPESKPDICYVYFCRTALTPYLYYLLLNLINVDFLIFLQIYLLVSITFLIRIKLINLDLSTWLANFLFLTIVINPKFLKYSFSTQEESFYIPALLFGISSLIGFITKKNIKYLIILNVSFALIVLIRNAGIIFYFLLILINIYYLIKIDDNNYKIKILLTFLILAILVSPNIINKNLTNYLVSKKINNQYFSMHALTSLISKQENFQNSNDDSLSKLINNRVTKLNNIREIEDLNKIKRLHFECVIFPAMNNLAYFHPKISSFYENNFQEDLNQKLFVLYINNFLKNSGTFLIKFNQCFFANFLLVELLTEEEIVDMKKILINQIFDIDDKKIIKRFHEKSKNYYTLIKPIRIINIVILTITFISIIISVKSLLHNKNDKFAILSIIFFCMYYLVINLHVNLVSVQVRFFFTYYPLLLFSNLKIVELINLFFIKKKYLDIIKKVSKK